MAWGLYIQTIGLLVGIFLFGTLCLALGILIGGAER